jgi:hypothetical protein
MVADFQPMIPSAPLIPFGGLYRRTEVHKNSGFYVIFIDWGMRATHTERHVIQRRSI